jgi:hypothetical protein
MDLQLRPGSPTMRMPAGRSASPPHGESRTRHRKTQPLKRPQWCSRHWMRPKGDHLPLQPKPDAHARGLAAGTISSGFWLREGKSDAELLNPDLERFLAAGRRRSTSVSAAVPALIPPIWALW